MIRPRIGITMGDPAGIGPEVIVKALADTALYEECEPLVIGDSRILQRDLPLAPRNLQIYSVSEPEAGRYESGTIDVLDLHNADPTTIPLGQLSAEAGHAAFSYVSEAIKLALAKQIAAICTAPLNKEAINLAGYHYAGHTEILAEQTGSKEYSMMLTGGNMRVLHVSTHVSLEEAIRRVTTKRVATVIRLAYTALRDLNLARQKIAVAGLNPHASEGVMFGSQETDQIIPAIKEARAAGLDVVGPLPPDTIFLRAKQGEFDAVIAMYHDQGHIPMKLLGFDTGVNVSVGLPVIRTSVDHGTAFDIAGQGHAQSGSMSEAIREAIRFARAKLARG